MRRRQQWSSEQGLGQQFHFRHSFSDPWSSSATDTDVVWYKDPQDMPLQSNFPASDDKKGGQEMRTEYPICDTTAIKHVSLNYINVALNHCWIGS